MKARIADLKSRLDEIGRLYKALRLPLMPIEARPNTSQLLSAYQMEAKCFFSSEMKRSRQSPEAPEAVFDINHQWLLLGRPVNQVLFDRRLRPICIRAPDPRYLALLKAYMTTEPGRALGMAQKDQLQAEILFRAIAEKMPHYPIGAEFRDSLAPDIAAVFDTCLEDGFITEDDMRPRPRW